MGGTRQTNAKRNFVKKREKKTLDSKENKQRKCKNVLKIVYHHFCIISEQVSSTTVV